MFAGAFAVVHSLCAAQFFVQQHKQQKMEHTEEVTQVPKLDAALLAEVVEESHAWAVAHGLVMGTGGEATLSTPYYLPLCFFLFIHSFWKYVL